MFNYILTNYVILILSSVFINAELSDKRLCADPKCSEVVSLGKAVLRYSAPEKGMLSFKAGAEVEIYSKEAGSNTNLWGVKIAGKRGYAPKEHIRELKRLSDATHLVDTHITTPDEEVPSSPTPTQAFDVYGGTTVYLNADEADILLSSTESPLKPTATVSSADQVSPSIQPQNGIPIEELPVKEEESTPDAISQQKSDAIEQPAGSILNNLYNLKNIANDLLHGGRGEGNDEEDDDEDFEEDDETDDEEEELDNENSVAATSSDSSQIITSNIESPLAVESSNEPLKIDDKQQNIEGKMQNFTQVNNDKIDLQNKSEESITETKDSVQSTINEELTSDTKETIEGAKKQIITETHTENSPLEPANEPQESQSSTTSMDSSTPVSKVVNTPENSQQKTESTAQVAENNAKDNLIESAVNPVNNDSNNIPLDIVPGKDEPVDIKPIIGNEKIESTPEKMEITTETPNTEQLLENTVANQVNTEPPIAIGEIVNSEIDVNLKQSADIPMLNSHLEVPNDLNDTNTAPPIINAPPGPISGEDIEISAQESSFSQSEPITISNEDNKEAEESRFKKNDGPSSRDILWRSSIRKELPIKDKSEDGKEQYIGDLSSIIDHQNQYEASQQHHPLHETISSVKSADEGGYCDGHTNNECILENVPPEDANFFNFNQLNVDFLLVLITTGVSIIIFLWGYLFIDKSRRERPLIGKINNLEKRLLILQRENELLIEKSVLTNFESMDQVQCASNELIEELKQNLMDKEAEKSALQEHVHALEKELENSTEVGLELNRMLSEFLSADNGSESLMANVEQLQRQLIEQQDVINTFKDKLSVKETENHELDLELQISNKNVTELQSELNKTTLNMLKIEEDKAQLQIKHESEINLLEQKIKKSSESHENDLYKLNANLDEFKHKFEEAQRQFELKSNEYVVLKDNVKKIKHMQNGCDDFKSIFDVTSIKSELMQLQREKELLTERVQNESQLKKDVEKQLLNASSQLGTLKSQYDEVDQDKMELSTKLEVLTKYFKETETQLQKDLMKYELMFVENRGEAISTTERMKYLQEQIQNLSGQNESLKQEIVAQEVQLKSQISLLEKKAHDNWVTARQAERRMEDAKQEAAQLRNHLTLRERALNEDKSKRIQSPLEHNGDISVSPLHFSADNTASSPLIFGRDHLTTSPSLPGMPPFLPPPPGVPFMPPPPGMPLPPPGFLPPPPSMLPGDQRLPPLGRMSSPPINSRYSPDSRAYSPYMGNSPSPTSDDDYDKAPPDYRRYSPSHDGRRSFRGPPSSNSIRNSKDTSFVPTRTITGLRTIRSLRSTKFPFQHNLEPEQGLKSRLFQQASDQFGNGSRTIKSVPGPEQLLMVRDMRSRHKH